MTEEAQQEQVKQSLDNLEALMKTTAEAAVNSTLQKLGIDASNPLQAQADFAKLRMVRKLMEDDAFLADLTFIRRWRTNSDKITDTGLKAVVRWFVVGVLGIIVLLSKDWWITHIKG